MKQIMLKNLFFKHNILSNIGRLGSNANIGKDCSIIGGKNILIGSNFYAESSLRLQTWEVYRGKPTGYSPTLMIGNNVSFMSNCHISCLNKVTIGDGCLFGDNVFVSDNSHGSNSIDEIQILPIKRDLFSKGSISIGNNVWVGRNVCILSNVTIGDNSIIGANSVVNKDIPANCVAAGNPAKVIKEIR